MTFRLELGINQRSVHADLKAASVRGNEREAFDQVLELLEQIVRQAHGPACVVSARAVHNLNLEHKASDFLASLLENYNMPRQILGIMCRPRYNAARYLVLKQGESYARLYVSL